MRENINLVVEDDINCKPNRAEHQKWDIIPISEHKEIRILE